MDIPLNNLVASTASFPLNVGTDDAPVSPLNSTFVNLEELVSQFRIAVIDRLIPSQRADSKLLDTQELAASSSPQPRPSRNLESPTRPDHSPSHARPEVPGEDILSRNIRTGEPPRNPLEVGGSDLDPFGGMRGRNPFAPPPLFPSAGGDGMFVGPEHPIFGGAFGPRGGPPPGRGPWGGDGYLPPMGAPPGARFDPVGPGNPLGGRGGLGSLGGRGPAARRSGEPDNDEFMPPGAVSLSAF